MNPLDAIKPATTGGFSFFELFMTAHPVVKIVMIGLLLASIWAWAIIIEKLFAFRRARREADRSSSSSGRASRWRSCTRACRAGARLSMASLFVAAMREWKRSVEGNIRAMGGIQLRVEKVMDVTISREMEQLDRRLLFLATVGSTAPFVGLFGTVWGIMTSFQAIAASKNTNLAVVAPGIAEALFATALGLLAAIPAVIFYNKFAADSSRLSQRLEAFADEFSAIVSRQIDVRDLRPGGSLTHGRQHPTPQRPGGGRRGRARKHTPMHEINVTPFVDVMLVLLIVFMVTAPLLTVGVPIELPETKGQQLQTNKEPVTISVDKAGKVFIQDTEVTLDEIAAQAQGHRQERLRRADLRSRRQGHRLRHGHAGDGPDQVGRLHQGLAGHRDRRGRNYLREGAAVRGGLVDLRRSARGDPGDGRSSPSRRSASCACPSPSRSPSIS